MENNLTSGNFVNDNFDFVKYRNQRPSLLIIESLYGEELFSQNYFISYNIKKNKNIAGKDSFFHKVLIPFSKIYGFREIIIKDNSKGLIDILYCSDSDLPLSLYKFF